MLTRTQRSTLVFVRPFTVNGEARRQLRQLLPLGAGHAAVLAGSAVALGLARTQFQIDGSNTRERSSGLRSHRTNSTICRRNSGG